MIKAETPSGNSYVIEKKNGALIVNGNVTEVNSIPLNPGKSHWIFNNKSYTVEVIEKSEDKIITMRINEKVLKIQLKDDMDVLLKELGMDNLNSAKVNDLKAPMPGLVVDIKVKEGQEIKKGDTIIVLEAMKMENALKASADAVVKKIAVNKGMAVEKNQVLVFLG